MISYAGVIVLCSDLPKGLGFEEQRFSAGAVEAFVDRAFADHAVAKSSMNSNGQTAISFFCGSNHDGGLREQIARLFDELAKLGSGIHAICSLDDDEANDGHGGAWEFRLNHPSLEIDLPENPIQRRDFTKQD